jgi:energy-coupling factor transporter ATP-binding protein EcfA2
MTSKLSDIVKINPRFCRSINISQDLDDVDILKSFICPNSFKLALSSMADNIKATGQSAFTWTGPYGAGKSSLALLLSSLVSHEKNLRDLAIELIGTDTYKNFNCKIKVEKGWAVLPIVGDVQDTQNLIAKNIENISGKKSKDIFADLKHLATKNDGLLIIIDEMGKCLEAAAKGIGEIYFFQQLAEFASRSKGRIILVGILHQSFADYARNLPHTMRDEWIKIQGRFVDTPINTAGEEQIELISRAITLAHNHNTKAIREAICPIAQQTVDTIKQNRVVISDEHLVESLRNCWPINPVVVCLLSQISRKKFGQNQRSIFSFLASGEPRAFRDFIETTRYAPGTMYMPNDLFEYIRFNLESAIMASSESKIWHIAIDALQRIQAKGLSEQHLDVLKTIALIDLFNGSSGLVADTALLEKLYSTDIQQIINDLLKYSVIIFKKHKNAYSVFEGSDFDIEAALREAYSNIVGLELSKLEEIANFKPIIAKRYYHQYGAMRWFDVLLTGVPNYEEFLRSVRKTSGAVGFFSILLPNSIDEEKEATKIVKQNNGFDFPVIMTTAHNVRLINEYLRELLALEWIQKSDLPGFSGDSIAQNIVEDRRHVIAELLEVQLGEILSKSEWYCNGESLGNISNNQLSALASDFCENEYPSSPKIKSELVNRTKPSGSANAAINALLKDMIINRGVNRLGIEGFSPEAGLFKILLQETGLYQSDSKTEFIYKEPTKSNPLLILWKETDKFLTKKHIVEAPEIFNMWSSRPFGIKAGLHNFFLLAYILTRENEVAVYREGTYAPNITDIFVDYLINKPKSISLKLVKSNDISGYMLVSIIKALNEISPKVKLSDNATPLVVAQRMVSIVDELHPWVLKTKTLANQTIKFREIVKSANDPNKLLFEDLSKLFAAGNLYENLKNALSELVDVYPAMIQSVGILMITELDILLPTQDALVRLRERAKNIKGVSGDFKIEAFAARLSTFEQKIADIAGIISLANNKPQNEWIDLDIETAKKELLYLCTEFKKTELYTKVKERPASRQAIAFIAGIGSNTEVVSDEFDLLTDKKKDVQKLKEKLKELLEKEKDTAIILTALSEISIEHLKSKGKK